MTGPLLIALLAVAGDHAVAPPAVATMSIPGDYDLAHRRYDDPARWLLPDVADSYERRDPPRLRIRGRKVKLRLPIG